MATRKYPQDYIVDASGFYKHYPVGDDDEPAYWTGGIWHLNGLMVVSSEPTTFDTYDLAVDWAKEARRERTCIYCGVFEPNLRPVPDISDDSAWTERAEEHESGCEWIVTRAHRLEGAVDA